MRESQGWNRYVGWFIGFLTVLMLGVGDTAAAEPKKFTFIPVVLDGTKIWFPSSLMVSQGEAVELPLINKLEDPHGFPIAEVGLTAVVQPQAQITVRCTAAQPGASSDLCHLHPPHLGGQMLVLRK